MKIKQFAEKMGIKIRGAVKPLRYRFTASFIMFAVILLSMLWLMQSVFMAKYYEISMEKKVESSMEAVELLYSGSAELSVNDFCNSLGKISQSTDIMFYVESADGSLVISSADQTPGGRFFSNSRNLITKAKLKMIDEHTNAVAFSENSGGEGSTIVHAKLIQSEKRIPIYVFAIASLTPIGPAVQIIRSQLLIVTLVALLVGAIISAFLSKRLATPIVGMGNKAKELAKGNYDVTFEGGHQFREVDELAETLTETAAELKKSDMLQKDLMANVSHDLRTPLTMIKSYAEMIRDLSGDIPEKRDAHLGVIIEETDRLSDLVNDVLTLSKMQAGVIELEHRDFDLQKAAESVLSTYMVLEQEGYSFSYRPLPSEIIVNGDERRIKQLIANLLSNAVRYSEDVKEISLIFEKTSMGVRCLVKDKGIGIPEKDLEKIWHRYERASSTAQRAQSGSSGLGLSIAAEILEKHNAKYGVESKVSEGSTFWFELPLACFFSSSGV